MRNAAVTFAAMLRKRDPSFRYRLPDDGDPGTLADSCAHQLLLDPRQRQLVLETLDVRLRVAEVTEMLTVQSAALEPDCGGPIN